MRRSRAAKMLGLLLALWSVLLTGEPLWLHSCPTMPEAANVAHNASGVSGATEHDAHNAPTVQASHDAHTAHTAHTATDADTESAANDGADSHHDSGGSPHECNCVGVCAFAGAVAAPQIAVIRVPAPAEVVAAGTRYPEHTSVDARPAPSSRLPWPTAPPEIA